MRRWTTVVIVLAALSGFGCAGPAKLTEKSESKLAEGDMWQAWRLATRALDKAPGNPRAREAAAAAASMISQDWQRRIVALADVDSMDAAEQVLKYVDFRAEAANYAPVPVGEPWVSTENELRGWAAGACYSDGMAAMKSGRPKKAYGRYADAMRFASNYRDVAARAEAALAQAQTQVAIVPLRTSTGNRQMSRDIAAAWNGALVEQLAGGETFTHILPAEDVERQLRLSDLGRTSRTDAIRIGKKAGADRVVWGSIGAVEAKTGVQFFTHNVWHRVPARDDAGRTVMRWVEIPFPVVARTRTVKADLAYEVISTRGGTTLARESGPRTLEARALWTAFVPDGAADTYMLVSEEMRRSDPDRAQQVEAEWANIVGASTTLSQVIEARRACANRPLEHPAVLARYASGAAFVMIEELPSTEELAQASLSSAWHAVHKSLLALDEVDDVDLGPVSASETP
jgi:hypothetical protein